MGESHGNRFSPETAPSTKVRSRESHIKQPYAQGLGGLEFMGPGSREGVLFSERGQAVAPSPQHPVQQHGLSYSFWCPNLPMCPLTRTSRPNVFRGQTHSVGGSPGSGPTGPVPLCCQTAAEARGGDMASGGPVKQEAWLRPSTPSSPGMDPGSQTSHDAGRNRRWSPSSRSAQDRPPV